jgi:hypothetical protein
VGPMFERCAGLAINLAGVAIRGSASFFGRVLVGVAWVSCAVNSGYELPVKAASEAEWLCRGAAGRTR